MHQYFCPKFNDPNNCQKKCICDDRLYADAPTQTPEYNELSETTQKVLSYRKGYKELKEADGTKYDGDKLRVDLIDPLTIEQLAVALTYGAKKYGDGNWLMGMQFSRLYGALIRHVIAWYKGEDIDEESGNHHLAHALAMLSFMVRFSMDDRYKKYDDRMFKQGVGNDERET